MNKTKFWLYLSIFSLLPIFFSTLMVALICFEWLLTDQSKFAVLFLTGHFNRGFSTFMFGLGTLGLSIVMTTVLMLFKHASKIDKLDEAIREHYEAKLKYHRATERLAEKS